MITQRVVLARVFDNPTNCSCGRFSASLNSTEQSKLLVLSSAPCLVYNPSRYAKCCFRERVCLQNCIRRGHLFVCGNEATRSGLPGAANRILTMAGDEFIAKREEDQKLIEEYLPDFEDLDELLSYLDLELESSSDYVTIKHFEMMFLIHEQCVDEKEDVIQMVQDFIEKNKGMVHRLNDWGVRNLANKIEKTSRANYVLMNIEINNQAIKDLNTLFGKDKRVIRHMIITRKAAITKECPPPEGYGASREVEDGKEEKDDDDDGREWEEEEERKAELVLQSQ